MRMFRVESAWGRVDELQERHLLRVEKRVQDGGQPSTGVFLQDKFLPVAPALARAVVSEGVGYLTAGRLSTNEPTRIVAASLDEVRDVRTGRYYGDCLVHVCIPRKPIREIQILSACFGEREQKTEDGVQVVRDYFPFDACEHPGIKVILESDDQQEALIQLSPGAAFRVHVTDDKPKGKNTYGIAVTWSGAELTAYHSAISVARPRWFGRRKSKETGSGFAKLADALVAAISA